MDGGVGASTSDGKNAPETAVAEVVVHPASSKEKTQIVRRIQEKKEELYGIHDASI